MAELQTAATLGGAIEGLRQAGADKMEMRRKAHEGRLSFFEQAKQKVQEFREKAANVAKTTSELALGMTTKEGRAALTQFASYELRSTEAAIRGRVDDARDAATDKIAEIATSVVNTGRGLAEGFKNEIWQPTVDQAKAIKDGVVHAAETGALFTAGMAMAGAEQVGRGIAMADQKVEAINTAGNEAFNRGVDWTKEQIRAGVERANQWGDAVHQYASDRVFNMRSRYQASNLEAAAWLNNAGAEIQGAGFELLTSGPELARDTINASKEAVRTARERLTSKFEGVRNGIGARMAEIRSGFETRREAMGKRSQELTASAVNKRAVAAQIRASMR